MFQTNTSPVLVTVRYFITYTGYASTSTLQSQESDQIVGCWVNVICAPVLYQSI